jgi:DNA-directed RNA polymerase specialized sigma24 family protein
VNSEEAFSLLKSFPDHEEATTALFPELLRQACLIVWPITRGDDQQVQFIAGGSVRKVFLAIGKFQTLDEMKKYLHTVSVNDAKQYLRHEYGGLVGAVRGRVDTIEDWKKIPVASDFGEADAVGQVLMKCFHDLPEKERQMLHCLFFADGTLESCGAVQNVGKVRAHQIKLNAFRNLRECLKRKLEQ